MSADVGEPFGANVGRARMERAGRKPRADAVVISEFAPATGSESHPAFGKVFKTIFGLSPGKSGRLDCRAGTRLLREE